MTHRSRVIEVMAVPGRFSGDGDEIVKNAMDSMGGFTIVLCGLKALLEHNIILNLVADRSPEGLVKG
jgi:hypothetical protein